jgi:TonB family protein
MRERISKAKAYIAVRNYNAAIYELENIRRETADPAVQGVVNVLLMNSYLEQSDFKRATDFLNEAYAVQKTTKPNAYEFYSAVASQVVKGARNRVERYRALGLSVSDRTLPLEATNDLEKMRESLELVITQAKEIAKDTKRTADAMMLVEEASTSRSMLGRDEYDARRWMDNVADTREEIASSRTVVTNVVNDTPPAAKSDEPAAAKVTPPANTVAQSTPASQSEPKQVFKPVTETATSQPREREVKQPDMSAKSDKVIYVPSAPVAVKESPKKADAETAKSEPGTSNEPLEVGSLLAFATRQSAPVYPPAARSTRTTGMVRVELTIDEKGDVAEVQNASGPMMLQSAAKDAVRRWKFKPFVRDGQPVRAVGYVSFNFAL